MRHEQHGAVVLVERALELLDGGYIQMIGRLVEDETVDTTGCEERHQCPSPFAG